MASDAGDNLGEHFEDFLDRLVADGRYASRAEALREALRRLEGDEKCEETFLRTLEDSLASGISPHASEVLFERARDVARGQLKP